MSDLLSKNEVSSNKLAAQKRPVNKRTLLRAVRAAESQLENFPRMNGFKFHFWALETRSEKQA
jgi:hypothetical protein